MTVNQTRCRSTYATCSYSKLNVNLFPKKNSGVAAAVGAGAAASARGRDGAVAERGARAREGDVRHVRAGHGRVQQRPHQHAQVGVGSGFLKTGIKVVFNMESGNRFFGARLELDRVRVLCNMFW